ncbi:Ig-like domain-containing protein, partial [Providencia rettgeri]|uniref:Ig-like domain-containing protein n=1 Tax=Providencia rettgeri TaxID=587 RepID=UPI0023AB39CA
VLADQRHDYVLTVEDAAGNQTEQKGQLTVDTQAPALIEKLDVNSDTGMIGDNLTRVNTPVLSGTTEAGLTVWLNIGTQTYSAVADQNGQWCIPVTEVLADQRHDYVLTVEDAAGNQTEQKGQLTVDTEAPELFTEIVHISIDEVSKSANMTFSGVAEPKSIISIKLGNNYYENIHGDDNGSWSHTIKDQPILDSYSYQLEIKDSVGNINIKKDEINLPQSSMPSPTINAMLFETMSIPEDVDNYF